MKFVEQIRKKLGVPTRYKMAVDVLDTSPQQYESLIRATDRIKFRDLLKLREVSEMSDTEFLDMIEREVRKQKKVKDR